MSTVRRSSPPLVNHEPNAVTLVPVASLRHIEGFSARRVTWLVGKILKEQLWTRPVILAPATDASGARVHLVMDGQHRTEAALRLGMPEIPAILFDYHAVEVWSLRPTHEVSAKLVIERTLAGNPYPYKTVKHRFASPIPELSIALSDLLPKGAATCG